MYQWMYWQLGLLWYWRKLYKHDEVKTSACCSSCRISLLGISKGECWTVLPDWFKVFQLNCSKSSQIDKNAQMLSIINNANEFTNNTDNIVVHYFLFTSAPEWGYRTIQSCFPVLSKSQTRTTIMNQFLIFCNIGTKSHPPAQAHFTPHDLT